MILIEVWVVKVMVVEAVASVLCVLLVGDGNGRVVGEGCDAGRSDGGTNAIVNEILVKKKKKNGNSPRLNKSLLFHLNPLTPRCYLLQIFGISKNHVHYFHFTPFYHFIFFIKKRKKKKIKA